MMRWVDQQVKERAAYRTKFCSTNDVQQMERQLEQRNDDVNGGGGAHVKGDYACLR